MIGNSLGYMATTCLILLIGGCGFQEGVATMNPSIPAQSMLRREDYSLEKADGLPISQNPAVLSLLEAAEQESAGEVFDKAAANIERALQIEPRNEYLYHRLALLRLRQERFEEAAALAAKSNSLASRNARLQEANWRVIAEARKSQGDEAGAAQAEQRAGQLREFLEQ